MGKLGQVLIFPEAAHAFYPLPFRSGALIPVHYKIADRAATMSILSLIHILSLATCLCV